VGGFIIGERISIVVFPSVFSFTMVNFREQRACITLYFKRGETVAETHQILKQDFGDNSLDQTQTYNWYKRF
jgi:hypothetical protein